MDSGRHTKSAVMTGCLACEFGEHLHQHNAECTWLSASADGFRAEVGDSAARASLAALLRDLGPIANELWNARGAHTPADLKALASRIMAAAEPAQRALDVQP
jgi:hypothetical protein